jgi:hypothetical protein
MMEADFLSPALCAAIGMQDAPLLLSAVEAVLKLADELTGDAAPSSAHEEALAWCRAECAARFRGAVLAALTGKEASGG